MLTPADILRTACQWRDAGDVVALATVTDTWGSSPAPPGSQMAVSASGLRAGSVSGGCIETAVVAAAQDVLATGRPRLLDFGVPQGRAWELGLACGGTVRIFLERIG